MGRRQSCVIAMLFALFLAFLWWNGAVREGVRSGLSLCASSLIPALFPFSVLTNLIIGQPFGSTNRNWAEKWMRKIFHLPAAAASALFFGLMGGYPIGAQITGQLRKSGRLSPMEAEHTASCCNNAGPAFTIGAVGAGVFRSVRIGVALFLIQVISALICCLLLRGDEHTLCAQEAATPAGHGPSAYITEAIGKSVFSMLRICGIVVFFSALTALMRTAVPLGRLPAAVYALLYGAVELTGGCFALIGVSEETAFTAAAVLLGWGGLCVHAQALDAFTKAEISPLPYLRGKMIQAVLCMILSFPVRMLLFARFDGLVFTGSAAVFSFFIIFCLFFQKQDWKSRRNMV